MVEGRDHSCGGEPPLRRERRGTLGRQLNARGVLRDERHRRVDYDLARDVRGHLLEDGDGLVSINRLNRGIAGVFHHIDRAHPQQHFVFDDENDCGNNGVIEGHHGGRFRRKEGNQLAS